MIVTLLRVMIYPESGEDWRTEDVPAPSWGDIETSIRRLDRDQYPFILLFRDPQAGIDDPADCSVVGGEGAFALDCTTADGVYRYHDPAHGDDPIDLWTSDQGAAFEERYVCYDLDTVLRATRHFCDHGAPDPARTWERRAEPL